MDKSQINKLFYRMKQTQDGLDFIEFLRFLSDNNYKEWKNCSTDKNDIVKGKALAYDGLIKVFDNCSDRLLQKDDSDSNAFI